jgi:hypothetical protein
VHALASLHCSKNEKYLLDIERKWKVRKGGGNWRGRRDSRIGRVDEDKVKKWRGFGVVE